MSVGEDSIVRATGFGPREGYAAARSLLGQTPAPTAVFVAAGDLSALGLVQAARERGLRLPQDLSIVGYDDLAVCERIDPPLSSVRPPLPDMAERLVQALAQGLPGQGRRAPLNLELAPKLVERKSCAVPPA